MTARPNTAAELAALRATVEGYMRAVERDRVDAKEQRDGMAKDTAAPYVSPVVDPAAELAAWREQAVVSPAQVRLTLFQLSLLDTVQSIADSDPAAAIVWEYAAEIRRNNALIDALGKDGFTPEQIDDIFRYAGQLVI